MEPVDTLCMGCTDTGCDFKPMKLQRRPVGEYDILIDMKYCGVCHSDLSCAAGHTTGVSGPVKWPCVPGHELAGICTQVGSKVTKFKVGQQVGVGCMVDACMSCAACLRGEEQMCSKQVGTYNSKDNGSGRAESYPAGGHTLGGIHHQDGDSRRLHHIDSQRLSIEVRRTCDVRGDHHVRSDAETKHQSRRQDWYMWIWWSGPNGV